MKLIKVSQTPNVNDEENLCIFNSSLNQDMIIKENSQIALQSLSFEIDFKNLIITDLDDELTMNLSVNNDDILLNDTSILSGFSYDYNDIPLFINDFTRALNYMVSAVPELLGVEFVASVSSSNRINVNCQKSKLLDDNDPSNPDFFTENITKIGGGAYISNLPLGSQINDAFFNSNLPMCRGFGKFSVVLNNVPTTPNGTIIAVTQRPLTVLDLSVPIELMKYGVFAKNGNYQYIEDGVAKFTGEAAALNDVLVIESDDTFNQDNVVTNKTLKLGYRRGGVLEVLHVISNYLTVEGNNNLYPVCVLQAPIGDNVSVEAPLYSPSPFTYSNTARDIVLSNDVIKWELGVQSIALAKRLGFTKYTTDSSISNFLEIITNNVNRGILIAQNKFDLIINNDYYLLQIDNINLQTYDDKKKGRMNILAVTSETTNDLNYRFRPPYPTFLDIDNYQPITLRNIRMKVLDEDLNVIKTVGESQATLLFKSKDE
jgi:hypothetical protein